VFPLIALLLLADLDVLQGSWRVIDARARMSNEPAMVMDGIVDRGTVQFIGNTITMRQLGNTDLASYSFTLDTIASPRRIRMIDSAAADGARWVGIYRVARDTLRLSLPVEHVSDRPMAPTSFNGPNTAAYTLVRVPPPRDE
jgi:uncharacterized protein (TIGR03067 family)